MSQVEIIDPKILSINASFHNGEFHIAGVSASALAEEFGTPAFIIDEDDFRSRALSFKNSLEGAFGENSGRCYYAAKAFLSIEIARWIADLGLSLDVCTGGELEVALAAQFPPDRMEFHGNNKSVSEIQRAIEIGMGRIVADSEIELQRINQIAGALGRKQEILIRLTPGVEAHTHEYISTAHEDVKFGFSIASGSAMAALKMASKLENLTLMGIHFHIGSQISSTEGFDLAIKRAFQLLADFRSDSGIELREFDIGGGYSISYIEQDESTNPREVMDHLAKTIKQQSESFQFPHPEISIEPGRAIAGPSTATLYEVGTVKEVILESGSRNYISVDGGMSDNIRTSLYDAQYSVALANRISQAPKIASRVVGKHCESGDIVVKDVDLPSDIAVGDLLVTPATGAYGRSMASNYNHLPRPPVVAVREGKARLIVRRETFEDLLKLDL
jgi:diaminopimelate decarboxylase